jgi:hypothetical protein
VPRQQPPTPRRSAKTGTQLKRESGGQTRYTRAFADRICQRVATGETLRAVCKELRFPRTTVQEWSINDVDGFAVRYARAREHQAESWADQLVAIADDNADDVRINEDGREMVDHDHINRARLRVDTRKWLLSKLYPKTYGEKVEHSGPDGGPIELNVTAARERIETRLDRLTSVPRLTGETSV